MTDDVALTLDERTELERLRAEVAELRSQAATAPIAAEPPIAPPPRPHRQRWRSVVATLLIVIGCILAPLSVVSIWTKNLVTDTDRYVTTVAPLAKDPAIQSAVADKITAEIFTHLDVPLSPTRLLTRSLNVGCLRSSQLSYTRCRSRCPAGSRASCEPRSGRWWPATRSPMPG